MATTQRPKTVGESGEWWWFRYSRTSDWQAVHVRWMSTSNLGVFVTGVQRCLKIESLEGEWSGPITPPKQ